MGKFISMKKIEEMEEDELLRIARDYYKIDTASLLTNDPGHRRQLVIDKIRQRRNRKGMFVVAVAVLVITSLALLIGIYSTFIQN